MNGFKLFVLSFIFVFIYLNSIFSQSIVFGPEKYIRENGKPQKVVKSFSISNKDAEFELYVQNGDGKKEKTSSALIEINGEVIVKPNDFNKNVDLIIKKLNLKNQNEIAVEVRSEPETYIIVTIYGPENPPSSVISDIKINPDEIFVNEQNYVTINAKVVQDILQYNPVLNLQRIDKYGNLISIEGNLYDEGDLNNGDEIAGDGIYSIKKNFLFNEEGKIYFRISINYNSKTYFSGTFNLYAISHLTEEDIDTITNIQENSVQYYNTLVNTIDHEAAMNEVLNQIKQNPNVLQADITEDKYGIWILYSSGILGAVHISPPDVLNESSQLKEEFANPIIQGREETSTYPIVKIGNRKAIVLPHLILILMQ